MQRGKVCKGKVCSEVKVCGGTRVCNELMVCGSARAYSSARACSGVRVCGRARCTAKQGRPLLKIAEARFRWDARHRQSLVTPRADPIKPPAPGTKRAYLIYGF